MKVSITRIGNSRGVRLPKSVLEQCGFEDAADLSVRDGAIVLRPVKRLREGWENMFPGGSQLPEEEQEWLDAKLTDDNGADWTWPDVEISSDDTKSGS